MEKDYSIDILKFLAAVFVLNSHMNWAYGNYSVLATGGAIGDVLFFFCSGYTLFLGRLGRFDAWYKRRIGRIYPSVFGFGLIGFLFLHRSLTVQNVIFNGGGNWFICCIMIYYFILFFVRKYFSHKLGGVFCVASFVVFLWYIFLFEEKDTVFMYKQTYFKWCHYFLFMLAGSIVGKNKDNISKYPIGYVLVFILLCVITFYGIQIVGSKSILVANFQILTLIPLLGIVYGFYLVARSNIMYHFYKQRICNWFVTVVGGLCLELYIVQMPILTGKDGLLPFGYYRDDLLYLFPLNIPVLVLIVIMMAYLTRVAGRWFSQTFDGLDGYRWDTIFSLK